MGIHSKRKCIYIPVYIRSNSLCLIIIGISGGRKILVIRIPVEECTDRQIFPDEMPVFYFSSGKTCFGKKIFVVARKADFPGNRTYIFIAPLLYDLITYEKD